MMQLFTDGRQTSERRQGFTGREETAEEIADEKAIRMIAAKEKRACSVEGIEGRVFEMDEY